MTLRRLLLCALLLVPYPASSQVIDYGLIATQDAGSCATANACVSFQVSGVPSATLQVQGTFSGTLTFEGTSDGATWFTLSTTKLSDGTSATTTTSTGQFAIPNSGLLRVRVRGGTFASGQATIYATRGFLNARLFSPTFGIVTATGFRGPVGTDCSDGTVVYSYTGDTNTGTTSVAADSVSQCAGATEVTRASTTFFKSFLPFMNERSSLGTTSTDGLVMQNLTAAAAGAQQMSPRLRFDGFGYATDAGGSSQEVSFINELLPVQGAAAPTANLLWKYAVNGGAYSTQMALDSAGALTTAGGITTGNAIGLANGGDSIFWASRGFMHRPADGVQRFSNAAQSTGFRIDFSASDGLAAFQALAGDDTATVKSNVVNATGKYQINGTDGVSATCAAGIASMTVSNGLITAITYL